MSKSTTALTPDQREQIRQRVLRGRIRLALQQPFLASALMRLPVREVHEASWCSTAATDGYHIFYNPRWIHRLTESELRGLLAHEVLHVLFTHSDRRGQRDARLWNVACDLAINHLLIERGFRLPKGGLISDEAKGKTSEELYGLLARQMRSSLSRERRAHGKAASATAGHKPSAKSGKTDDEDDDQGDQVPEVGDDLIDPDDPRVRPMRSADAPDREQAEELRRELRQDALARLQGSSADQFRQECDADESGRVDWRALLRAWLSDRIKGDWTSFPFSKRWLHRGLFMPSPGVLVPGHVVFAIDTSGSMSLDLLAQIVGELRAFREVFPCRLSVLQCDDRIQQVQEFDALDGYEIPPSMRLRGRGGTDFRPVFEWVQSHAPGAVVIYATDGMGTFPQRSSLSPTIWLHTPPHTGARFPFGSVVRVGLVR